MLFSRLAAGTLKSFATSSENLFMCSCAKSITLSDRSSRTGLRPFGLVLRDRGGTPPLTLNFDNVLAMLLELDVLLLELVVGEDVERLHLELQRVEPGLECQQPLPRLSRAACRHIADGHVL